MKGRGIKPAHFHEFRNAESVHGRVSQRADDDAKFRMQTTRKAPVAGTTPRDVMGGKITVSDMKAVDAPS